MGDQSWRTQPHFISMDTVRKAAERVREHAIHHGLKSVSFSFHGGEPLLAGPQFFSAAVPTIRQILGPVLRCSFGVQTNGTLISAELLQHVTRTGSHIGRSRDGPSTLSDTNRLSARWRRR